MYKLVRIFIIFLLLNSAATTKSLAQWTEVYFDSVSTINNIFCLNSDTCFITFGNRIAPFNGKVLKTVNGGVTWDTIIHTDTSQSYESIFFINDTVGFLTDFGNVLRTYDGGNTWISYADACSGFFAAASHAFNIDTVLFAGGCGVYGVDTSDIYLTTDGGVTLNPLPLTPACLSSSIPCCFNNLFFLNDSVGFAGGQGCIYKTSDRGFTWNMIYEYCNDSSFDIATISFYNDTMGWFGGESGPEDGAYSSLDYTTDGGYTWNKYTTMPFYIITDLAFFPDGNGYLTDFDKIYKTTDYGVTFNEQYLLSYSNDKLLTYFNRFFFLNSQVGYITATHSVLKTTNGGVGLKELSIQNNYLKTYPNPNNGAFHLSMSTKDQSPKDIFIYDVFGKQIFQNLQTDKSDLDIDISKNAKGVYLVKVVSEGKVSVSRVMFM